MRVPRAFKDDFDLVHEAFRTGPDEVAYEKERLSLAGGLTDDAVACYAATAALIRAGWNPAIHWHVALWRRSDSRSTSAF